MPSGGKTPANLHVPPNPLRTNGAQSEVQGVTPCLDFHDDGEDHGVALDLFENVAVQLVFDAVLQILPLAAVDATVVRNDSAGQFPTGLDDVLVFPHVDETAADKVGAGNQRAVVPVDGHNHDDQTVLTEVLAVAQHHVAHVADAQTIHQNAAGGHHARDGQTVLTHFDDLTDLGNNNVGTLYAQLFRQLGVLPEVGIFAVDRDEVLLLAQGMEKLDLFLTGMAGNVDFAQLTVDDVRAAAVQLIDDPGHGLFRKPCGSNRPWLRPDCQW